MAVPARKPTPNQDIKDPVKYYEKGTTVMILPAKTSFIIGMTDPEMPMDAKLPERSNATSLKSLAKCHDPNAACGVDTARGPLGPL